jgi:hypothetical protein
MNENDKKFFQFTEIIENERVWVWETAAGFLITRISALYTIFVKLII